MKNDKPIGQSKETQTQELREAEAKRDAYLRRLKEVTGKDETPPITFNDLTSAQIELLRKTLTDLDWEATIQMLSKLPLALQQDVAQMASDALMGIEHQLKHMRR